jgi:hypothetical protein
MLIYDLEHLEVVREENQVQGGAQFIAVSSGSGAGLADYGSVSINGNSGANASEYSSYYGSSRGVSAYSSVYGSTSPY